MGIAGFDDAYEYAEVDRAEMGRFIPPNARRVLDVGCDQGYFARTLRRSLPDCHLVGVEPVAAAAAAARRRGYSIVLDGLYPEALRDCVSETRPFDVVFFLDVLEHMADPWNVLRQTHEHLRPGGYVIASIPNVRYFPVSASLLFRGRFDYADYGVLDKTHLRFFTRRSIEALFRETGYHVEEIKGLAPFPNYRKHLAFRPFRALLREAKFMQYAVVATRPS